MLLNIDIKRYLRHPLNNGFEITKYADHGMAESCRLEYPILDLVISRDRFDYSASIIYNDVYFDVVHLSNFINGNKDYVVIDPTGTEHVDVKRYLTLINRIFELEFDKILEFLFQLSESKKDEFRTYVDAQNEWF